MKKLLSVTVGVLALGAVSMSAAGANSALNTPIGNLGVNQDGYIVVADGNSGNPDPLDGYIGISDDPGCVGAFDGGPYNDDGTNNGDHVDSPCEAPA